MKNSAIFSATCFVLALGSALPACGPYLDTFTLGDDGGTDSDGMVADSGEVELAVLPADILFVIDNSVSMLEEQENLAQNFARFIDQVAGIGDYRIAVVSTDTHSEDGESGGFSAIQYSAHAPFPLVEISVAGCMSTGIEHGCFRGPDPAKRVISSATMTRDEQIAAFQENVRVGTCGTGSEAGIDAMLLALERTAGGDCNGGFLRRSANLIVVLVSDEDDDSGTEVDLAVARMEGFKQYSNIRVATIVGSVDGDPQACGVGSGALCGSLCNTPPPPGSGTGCMLDSACPPNEYCDRVGGGMGTCENEALRWWPISGACASCSYYNTSECCSASAGGRYIELARRIEVEVAARTPLFEVAQCRGLGPRVACLADSICQDNFGDTLSRIARELVLVR